jgi:hypothetical protein
MSFASGKGSKCNDRGKITKKRSNGGMYGLPMQTGFVMGKNWDNCPEIYFFMSGLVLLFNCRKGMNCL